MCIYAHIYKYMCIYCIFIFISIFLKCVYIYTHIYTCTYIVCLHILYMYIYIVCFHVKNLHRMCYSLYDHILAGALTESQVWTGRLETVSSSFRISKPSSPLWSAGGYMSSSYGAKHRISSSVWVPLPLHIQEKLHCTNTKNIKQKNHRYLLHMLPHSGHTLQRRLTAQHSLCVWKPLWFKICHFSLYHSRHVLM